MHPIVELMLPNIGSSNPKFEFHKNSKMGMDKTTPVPLSRYLTKLDFSQVSC